VVLNRLSPVSGPPSARTPGQAAADDPIAIADALAAAAGGAESGVAAVAARMLRSHAATQQALEAERREAQQLREEVAELNETMTTKTFKAPSAWAEREVKYKQDKRRWEEAQKDADGALTALRQELSVLRSASGTDALDHRIEELEARLVESERDRSALRAAMHELQLASKPQAGEFSDAGIKPYSRPRLGGDAGEVQQVVDQIHSSSSTPRRPSNPASPAFASSEVARRLESVERENRQLRTQLEQVHHARGSALETPEVVRKAMDVTASAKAKVGWEEARGCATGWGAVYVSRVWGWQSVTCRSRIPADAGCRASTTS
jgi:chromosome segregation ATPase